MSKIVLRAKNGEREGGERAFLHFTRQKERLRDDLANLNC